MPVQSTLNDSSHQAAANPSPKQRARWHMRLRNYFLTGLVATAPIGITTYLTWTFVAWVDAKVKPLIPARYNPDSYLPFTVPGVGLLFAMAIITLLGFLTANLLGSTLIGYGESLLDRMPLVRNIYRGLKQLFETALSRTGESFQKVALVQYPRPGVWRVGFVATRARGEIELGIGKEEPLAVFIPNTPNVTAGFLVFVPRTDAILLEMNIEQAAKLIISAGLVAPPYPASGEPRRTPLAGDLPGFEGREPSNPGDVPK